MHNNIYNLKALSPKKTIIKKNVKTHRPSLDLRWKCLLRTIVGAQTIIGTRPQDRRIHRSAIALTITLATLWANDGGGDDGALGSTTATNRSQVVSPTWSCTWIFTAAAKSIQSTTTLRSVRSRFFEHSSRVHVVLRPYTPVRRGETCRGGPPYTYTHTLVYIECLRSDFFRTTNCVCLNVVLSAHMFDRSVVEHDSNTRIDETMISYRRSGFMSY